MNIIKLGGSLLQNVEQVFKLLDFSEDIIVPGGSYFAESIRIFSKQYTANDEVLHKMAIYSMHQFGIYLSSISGIPCIESLNNKSGIFLPYRILEEYNPFPYSWDVTSDSIAVFIAYLFDIKIVRLIKMNTILFLNNKQVYEIKSSELKNIDQNIVDRYFVTCINKYKINCEIYDASNLNDLKKNYNSGKYSLKIRYL